jgi:hypothetical protein
VTGNEADNLEILSAKKSIKDEARVEAESQAGNVLGDWRERSELRHCHSFFGWLARLEISNLKWERRAEVMSFARCFDWVLRLYRSTG